MTRIRSLTRRSRNQTGNGFNAEARRRGGEQKQSQHLKALRKGEAPRPDTGGGVAGIRSLTVAVWRCCYTKSRMPAAAEINISELAGDRGVRECLQWLTREKQWINEIHLQLCRIAAPTFLEQDRDAAELQ